MNNYRVCRKQNNTAAAHSRNKRCCCWDPFLYIKEINSYMYHSRAPPPFLCFTISCRSHFLGEFSIGWIGNGRAVFPFFLLYNRRLSFRNCWELHSFIKRSAVVWIYPSRGPITDQSAVSRGLYKRCSLTDWTIKCILTWRNPVYSEYICRLVPPPEAFSKGTEIRIWQRQIGNSIRKVQRNWERPTLLG
jgi:hypothetical protein